MGNTMFATEEDRVKAINDLGDDPSKFDELEAIRNAAIGTEPDNTTPEGQTPLEPPPAAPAEPAVPAIPRTYTITDKDLPEGFDTPGKAFKSLKEAQDLIRRQTTFIKENLNKPAAATPEMEAALERARKAEEELAKLKPGSTPSAQSAATSADIGAVQTELQRVEALQAELEKEADEDPDIAFTGAYQKKMRDLSRLQTSHLNHLTGLLTQAKTEIQEARSENANRYKQDKEDDVAAKSRQALYDEMTSLDVPELKLTKKTEEVEGDYLQWRRDVALAFYGRPAANVHEEFAALEQLQLRNPDTIQKCALIGVKTEPSEDVKRYMKNCEFLDFQMGWRKDPTSGKLERLMKYDPASGTQVPVILPSLKAAIQQKRIEEGYYEKKVDGAFQQGAQSVAAAAQRRDMGAVELNERGDQSQTPASSEWALRTLQEIDAETAMTEYRRGDKTKFNELNKARNALQLEPITFRED